MKILFHHWTQNPHKWGVGHLKTQKKKPNFGGNTHVTLNPKP
jgi:hypothetical protein